MHTYKFATRPRAESFSRKDMKLLEFTFSDNYAMGWEKMSGMRAVNENDHGKAIREL